MKVCAHVSINMRISAELIVLAGARLNMPAGTLSERSVVPKVHSIESGLYKEHALVYRRTGADLSEN